jgi:hypothetical protein
VKHLTWLAAGACALSLVFGLPQAAEAKNYKNCTELREDYPGEVAKSKSSKNIGGKTKNVPVVNAKLYSQVFKKMDRDKDGIACEN